MLGDWVLSGRKVLKEGFLASFQLLRKAQHLWGAHGTPVARSTIPLPTYSHLLLL